MSCKIFKVFSLGEFYMTASVKELEPSFERKNKKPTNKQNCLIEGKLGDTVANIS